MPTPCKICGSETSLHGAVDFNKCCPPATLEVSGIGVEYHRCGCCGFLFADRFDGWTHDDWRREVYNDGYGTVDPDAAWTRPAANAPLAAGIARQIGAVRVLDYGGGNGLMARIMTESFWDAHSWDVLGDDAKPAPGFDLVTSFEVFEHTPTPVETLTEAVSFLRPGGAMLFSTLTVESPTVDHWYVAPRNGHVSIHTTKSLDHLFRGVGWKLEHLSAGLHFAREASA